MIECVKWNVDYKQISNLLKTFKQKLYYIYTYLFY